MSDEFEVMMAFEIGKGSIELVGTVTEKQIEQISLTEHAAALLRSTSLGSADVAIKSLLKALGLTADQQGSFNLKGLLTGIPGVEDVIDRVLEADLFLTHLSYTPNKELVIGILIEFDLTVGPVHVSRIGLKVTHDLRTPEEA